VEGKQQYVHRLAYSEAHGVVLTREDYVCHACDNPACYRVDHLFLGTAADNSRDAVQKGRQAKGFMLPHTRFSVAEIDEMKSLWLQGVTQTEIARRYGTIQSYVSQIVAGKRRVTLEG
jgi:hypothetical protein